MTRREYRLDLHVHTCLSPCGELSMLPTVIVARAREKGIDVIAICDHNSAENVGAVQRAARGSGVTVFGGMEVTTREEIHLVALFGGSDETESMQSLVYANLVGNNDAEAFGEQVVVDENDVPTALNERLLIGATTVAVDRMVREIHNRAGVAIASHVDRPSYSLVGQLGFVPPGLAVDALEVSARCTPRQRAAFGESGIPLLTSSDAHFPEDIGRVSTDMTLEEPSFDAFVRKLGSMRRGGE